MLSGEGNAGERWKTTIGLISKKATLHVQHTFLYIYLPLFCTTTAWNFKKLPGYSFMEETSHLFLFIFCHCCSFSCTLVATSISYFPTATTKFSCCSSNKKMSPLFFSSRSRSLSPLKPGCHMSEKSQTIGDFAFCRPSQTLPIYRIIARSLSQILERRHVSLW